MCGPMSDGKRLSFGLPDEESKLCRNQEMAMPMARRGHRRLARPTGVEIDIGYWEMFQWAKVAGAGGPYELTSAPEPVPGRRLTPNRSQIKDLVVWCPGEDSNLHGLSTAST
jgi:hypothetical protein